MNVLFRSNALEACAYSLRRAQRRWGTVVDRNYVDRIALITAVGDFDALREYQHFRVHRLRGPRQGTWAINLSGGWRIIFQYDATANAILIVEVVDYRG